MAELNTVIQNIFRMTVVTVSFMLSGCDGIVCSLGGGDSCLSAGGEYDRMGNPGRAAKYYESGCGSGNAEACYLAGIYWSDGGNVHADYSLAADLLQKGCKTGHGGSCRIYGEIMRDRFGDHLKAAGAFDRACRLRDYDGCNDLGGFFRNGFVTAPDDATAMNVYDLGCRNGNGASCFLLAGMHEERDMSELAFSFYDKSCTLNYGEGCNRMGSAEIQKENGTPGAMDFFRKSCELGVGEGCFNLAEIYYGSTEYRDFAEALVNYTRACRLKHGHSCHMLGDISLRGEDFSGAGEKFLHNPEIARTYLEQACDLGDADACSDLGGIHYEGAVIRKNPEEARRFFWRSCTSGSSYGCVRIGDIYRDGIGVNADEPNAVRYYGMACDMDNGTGCHNLARVYMGENYADRKAEDAYRLAQKSCSLDYAPGCRAVGDIFDKGIGRGLDVVLADKYYDVACNMRDGTACFYLGVAYYIGRGVPQNFDGARAYVALACELGEAQGCTGLGLIYLNGRGVDTDYGQAIKYISMGCSLRDRDACNNLGVMYERGNGVEQDIERAKEFYRSGCDFGSVESCFAFDDLNSREQAVGEDGDGVQKHLSGADAEKTQTAGPETHEKKIPAPEVLTSKGQNYADVKKAGKGGKSGKGRKVAVKSLNPSEEQPAAVSDGSAETASIQEKHKKDTDYPTKPEVSH